MMFIENVVILSKSEYRQVKCCGLISVSKEMKLYAKSLMNELREGGVWY